MCYSAGGMSFSFTHEDFLVFFATYYSGITSLYIQKTHAHQLTLIGASTVQKLRENELGQKL